MFTGVAQHQRHDFCPSSQTLSHHFRLYDIGNDAASVDVGYHGSKDISSDTYSAKKVQRTYAYPSRSSSSFTNRIPLSNVGGPRVDVSEHMLRRKTPNGTLAAGYDGTPVEWTKRPNTLNNATMSESRIGSRSMDSFVSRGGHEKCIPLKIVPVRVDGDSDGIWNQSLDMPQDGFPSISPTDGENGMAQWARKSIQPIGLDSMLNQAPIPQQFYHPTGFHEAPTVLQPMWPPYIGSMSLNDSYFPKSYGQTGTHQITGPQDMHSLSILDAQSVFQSVQMQPVDQRYGDRPSTFGSDTARRKTLPLVQGRSLWSNPQHSANFLKNSSNSQELRAPQKQSSALDRHRHGIEQIHLAPLTASGGSQTGTGTLSWKQNAPSLPKTSPSHFALPDRTLLTNSLHFKEKVLVWAHRAYINLLASHHQNRKYMHGKHNTFDRQPLSACIYPRPPGHYPRTSRGSDVFSQRSPGHSIPSLQGSPGPSIRLDPAKDKAIDMFEPMSESKSHLWPLLDGSPRSAQQTRGLSKSKQYQSPPTHPFSSHGRNKEECERASLVPPNQHQDYTQSEARRALDIIVRLCQESQWQWTDGLLLGGCLAYALAEYDQALLWYSKVLSYEPA